MHAFVVIKICFAARAMCFSCVASCRAFFILGATNMSVDFEKSFADFLDRKEYDDAESSLFSIVRSAYKAG